jgi:hypothetical protein
MFRGLALALLTATSSIAPIQCGSERSAELAYEETPGEALYMLANVFKQAGDEKGWRRTLEYLIARQPASRFAVTARQDLADAGFAVPEDDAEPDGGGSPAVTAK